MSRMLISSYFKYVLMALSFFYYYFFKFEDGALSFSGTLDSIGGTERSEIALIETSPSVVLQIVQHL